MKTKKTIGWVISIVVILFLLFDSIGKMIKIEQVVTATVELGYLENSVRLIGTILLLSTTLYIIPKTSIVGVILLTAYLGGAVATQIRVDSPIFSHVLFPVYVGVLAWLGLILRNEDLLKIINNKI